MNMAMSRMKFLKVMVSPVDPVENGEAVHCPAGISQEHLQRAKNLSHEDQKKLQRKRKDRTMRKQQKKPVEEKFRILHILEDDHLDGETLLELIGGPETSARQILAQTEPEQSNNKRCKFLLSQGLVPSHVCPPLTLPCSFIVGLAKLLKAFIHAEGLLDHHLIAAGSGRMMCSCRIISMVAQFLSGVVKARKKDQPLDAIFLGVSLSFSLST